MDRLRALFEELSMSSVETLIASGNVIFDSRARTAAALERRIASHLKAKLGYAVDTFVRTPAQIDQVAALEPFAARDVRKAHALMVLFLGAEPDASAVQQLGDLSSEIDRFRLVGRELYWLRMTAESDPKLAKSIERAVRMPSTVRNINTVRRIAENFAS
jgi:uncharacterized protein (DUF1697 family)